ncbi:MAG: aldo/keto reductase, partial [Xanthomonadales bacterium]|nr:aldo/keto reductase [Xanthomonadales bacterium]
HGIGQVVFSPLEQGILTGKYKPGEPLPAGSRASDDRQNQWIKDLAGNQEMLERVQQLQSIADEAGCTIGQLSLAWILQKDGVTSCITGATRTGQIRENCAASRVRLSQGHLERIDQIIMPATFSHEFG